MALTLHAADEIKAIGRLKDGDKWFRYGWSKAGVTTARDFYIRFKDGLLMVEVDDNNGGGRSLKEPQYLSNHTDLPFVQQSVNLFATVAQMASKGIAVNGPLNLSATAAEIPFEIVDVSGKIAAKALPTDAGKETEKATQVLTGIANNLAATTTGGGSTTTTSSTRNVVGYIALGLLAVGIVAGVVALVRYFGKKKNNQT